MSTPITELSRLNNDIRANLKPSYCRSPLSYFRAVGFFAFYFPAAMKKTTVRYWGTVGYDQFGRNIPGEFLETVTDEPMQQPQIHQQTAIYPQTAAPIQAAPSHPQPIAAQPQPVMWQPPRPGAFPIVSAIAGIIGIVGFLSAQSRVSELQSQLNYQTQQITQLQSQIRDRDIQIQSYERMAAIVR